MQGTELCGSVIRSLSAVFGQRQLSFRNLYLFTYLFFSEDSLKRLGQDVSLLSMSKDSLGWDLVALERAVQAARDGQSDSDDEEPESETPAV